VLLQHVLDRIARRIHLQPVFIRRNTAKRHTLLVTRDARKTTPRCRPPSLMVAIVLTSRSPASCARASRTTGSISSARSATAALPCNRDPVSLIGRILFPVPHIKIPCSGGAGNSSITHCFYALNPGGRAANRPGEQPVPCSFPVLQRIAANGPCSDRPRRRGRDRRAVALTAHVSVWPVPR
jgi:hypothetical protein